MRNESIKKSSEFRFLFKNGKSWVTVGFVCYYLERNGSIPPYDKRNRIGIVASKKIGNAVRRNRAKRVIREAFRVAESRLCEKTDKRYDFVFVARGKTPYLKSTEITEWIGNLFNKI